MDDYLRVSVPIEKDVEGDSESFSCLVGLFWHYSLAV